MFKLDIKHMAPAKALPVKKGKLIYLRPTYLLSRAFRLTIINFDYSKQNKITYFINLSRDGNALLQSKQASFDKSVNCGSSTPPEAPPTELSSSSLSSDP